MPIARTILALLAVALFAMAPLAGRKATQAQGVTQAPPVNPLDPLRSGVAVDQIISELVAHNESRSVALLEYAASRTYQVIDAKGKVRAEEIGRMEFHAPDKKTFLLTSEGGSGIIRRLALNPLIASEIEAASGKQHHDSSITPANYTFNLLGEQQVGPYRCFVAQAIPKRKDKYLFEGKVWIDVHDYAVVRIEGQPAKKLSFWIDRADFVRQYQKISGFWLPLKDETYVQVKFYGKSVLTIDHKDYVVKPAAGNHDSVGGTGNF